MKPSAFWVRISPGPLIIGFDLAEALHAVRPAGAAVDVLPAELPAAQNPRVGHTGRPGSSWGTWS